MNFYEMNYDDSKWLLMDIPGIWERNGFGDPEYVNAGFAWMGHFKIIRPRSYKGTTMWFLSWMGAHTEA